MQDVLQVTSGNRRTLPQLTRRTKCESSLMTFPSDTPADSRCPVVYASTCPVLRDNVQHLLPYSALKTCPFVDKTCTDLARVQQRRLLALWCSCNTGSVLTCWHYWQICHVAKWRHGLFISELWVNWRVRTISVGYHGVCTEIMESW